MIPKFRAWYTPFGGSVKQFNKMKHGSAGSLLTHAEMSPDDYKIMQSIGLKDKNGVEIFDGDYLRRKVHIVMLGTDFNEWIDETVQVEWKYGGWHVGEDLLEFSLEAGTDRHTGCYQTALEVIGNIWENSELLEAE